MKNPLRRYAVGALAIGAVAAGTAIALPGVATDWKPVEYNLTASPASILPATVTSADPVRVVSTALDAEGRPVVTVKTATSKAAADRLVTAAQKATNAVGVEVDAKVTTMDVSSGTDPYRSQQWDLTKIGATTAWQRSTGSGVTVAVIDTGVDATNPDLKGQVLPEYDVIGKSTLATSTDQNGHGTHVAGTIAALTGNGVGVSGFAPDAKILPVRVLDANGSGYMSDAATGIIYAADHGANVINMSLGTTSQVAAVTNAIAYARSKGVVVVAAAGNSRADGSPTSYPAADPGVIAVAATDANDKVASYSNAGGYVDVAAPGSDILSTYPVSKGTYATMSGTSMASPHVAALAALLKAYRSTLTPDQIEAAIESTAVDLGTAGKDNDYGYGRIDDAAALAAVSPTTTAPTTTAPTTSGSASPSATKTTSPTTTAPTTTAPTSTVPTTTAPATTAPTTSAPTTSAPVSTSPSPSASGGTVTPVIKTGATGGTITYGTQASATFTVTGSDKPWALKPVQVCFTPAGGSATCQNATLSSTGTITVQRQATAAFSVTLTVLATSTSAAVTSAPITWTPQASVTVSRSGNTMTVTIVGAVGQKLTIERLDGTTWTEAGTTTAKSERLTVSNLVGGRSYRVTLADTATVKGAVSKTV